MINYKYPYVKLTVPIEINRDYTMIVKIKSLSFQDYTFQSQLLLENDEKLTFTVTKEVQADGVLLTLNLTELQTADLEHNTIAKFDIATINDGYGTLFAGEIPIVNTITEIVVGD